MPTRNDPHELARRTRKNLEYLEHAYAQGADVHVVTHRVVSLLGLVIFPYAEGIRHRLETQTLSDLIGAGWPGWNITCGAERTKTLSDLLRHFRNAIAHGHISFDSDSPDPANVKAIKFWDIVRSGKHEKIWEATISADDLRAFCEKFMSFIDPSAQSDEGN